MVTEYQLSREEQMNVYLNSLKDEAKRINGDESVIFLAQDLLTLLIDRLAQRNLVLEIPDCCPNNGSQGDFHVMFVWDKDEHYLECEIPNSHIMEFFYRNRFTKQVWGEDFDFAQCQSNLIKETDELLDKLSLFVE